MSTLQVGLLFAAASAAILVAGVALETSGSLLADRSGINGVVFGATFLAAASALPEMSTGLEAVRLGDNELAIGDIFGGNAFQLCLFVLADLVAGSPVLPHRGRRQNAWLASLGVALTAIFAMGVIDPAAPLPARGSGPTRSLRSSSSRSGSRGSSSSPTTDRARPARPWRRASARA